MSTPAVQRPSFYEVVDDSEPERAKIRRRRRKAESNSLSTDSSEEKSRPTFKVHNTGCDNDIIEITDSDSEPDKQPSRRLARSDQNATPSSFSSKASLTSGRMSTVNGSLERFAFVTSTNNSTLRRGSTLSVLPSRNEGVASSHVKPSPFDLANLDLTKLFGCVSCEVGWTAKKTAKQKMEHIRKCAKKKALSDETIWTLAKTEILKPISQIKGNHQEEKNYERVPRKNTLLEDVVVDAAPKKKGKRKQAATVLTTVPATRDMILVRAKNILSVPPPSVLHQREADLPSDGSDEEIPQPTLSFAPSSLAQLQGTATRTLFADSSSSWRRTDSFGSYPPNEALEADEIVRPHMTKSKVKTSLRVEPPERNASSEVDPQSPTDFVDSTSSSGKKSMKKDKKAKTRLPSYNLSPVSTTDDIEATPTKKKGKGSTQPRSSKKTLNRTSKFGDDWEDHMKRYIMQNVDLHHRVLRYEVPIQFNVFMELATLYAPSSSRLKLHLRNFLDCRAIHFYEGQSWKR
ncbi:hypothetical protein CPB84DRAFT_1840798 [Gymnopilus junonius]|uniref:Uncharacterized protein n=1 Tax=Gymnopilus junonius TaxID=109634 RepID=A0A9P5TUY1_GYMJU|nr:hypothetical protein CPB84DRAFT_1840798 [Gymnopilus junonius]